MKKLLTGVNLQVNFWEQVRIRKRTDALTEELATGAIPASYASDAADCHPLH